MMAMSLSSCTSTLLMMSRAPPRPTPTPRKSSPGAGSLQLRSSRQPAAAAAAASSRSRRAAVFACHALNKYSYHHIDPTALVFPTATTLAGTNWRISSEDKDLIILELEVGEDLTKDKLEVSTTDHVLLVVKYKGDINDECRASSLDVRLLMPPGYDHDDKKNVGAMMSKGWLKITIPKPDHKPKNIEISTP